MDRVKDFKKKGTRKPLFFAVIVVLFTLQPATANAIKGYASSAQLKLSDSRPYAVRGPNEDPLAVNPVADNVTYAFTNTVSSTNAAQTIGCIKIQFATTPETGNTIPTNMDVSAVAFNSGSSTYQASWAGWAVAADGGGAAQSDFANGRVTLVDGNGGLTDPIDTAGTIILTGIKNGTVVETAYYARFNTYTDAGCTTDSDEATVAFIYQNGQLVSAVVDPSLSFTLIGTSPANYNDASHCDTYNNGIVPTITTTNGTVPFGHPVVNTPVIGLQRLTVGTNATGGMYVYTWATQQLTSAQNTNDTIDAVGINTGGASNAAPQASATAFATGKEAWGYSTGANDSITPGNNLADDRFDSNKWAPYITTANTDHVFYANAVPVDNSTAVGNDTLTPTTPLYAGGRFCVGYKININSITEAGFYTATVIYNAVPTY